MLTNRWRATLAGLTVALAAFSLVLVASGSPAGASHIPATGPIPSNCVEFQAGATGSKTVLGVTITLNSWTNTSGDPHTVSFTISGLTGSQSVDVSVKSGTDVQEYGPFGNGAQSINNNHQNAISHIRLCVFGQPTTTTSSTSSTTSSTTTSSTTTTTEPTTTSSTTTTTEPTTTTSTTTTTQPTTTTTVDDTTTTTVDDTTTTSVDDTTTTTAPGTSTTDPDEVEGTVITSTTMGDEVAGTTIVADELPFTGFDSETLGQLAVIILALGVLTLLGAQAVRARSNDES